MAGIRAAKKELRALIRQRLSQISPESVHQQSAAATEILLSLPEYRNAQCIGVYLSMPNGEVLTKTIVYDALRQGKQIYVPYIYENKVQSNRSTRSAMNMVSLHSQTDYEALEPDTWGIPSVGEDSITKRVPILEEVTNSERDSKNKSTECRRLDLIVMPGLAFDRDLGRLGHGKGFYDYFLKCYHDSKIRRLGEEIKMPFLVGLALDVQLLPNKIPTDSSDWNLDALVVGDGSVVRS